MSSGTVFLHIYYPRYDINALFNFRVQWKRMALESNEKYKDSNRKRLSEAADSYDFFGKGKNIENMGTFLELFR